MLLYKTIKAGDKPHSNNGFFYLATTPKNAFMWAETLWGEGDKYFIDEYKIPNSEMCLYNTNTYVMRQEGNWRFGTFPPNPIPVGDLPSNLPDTAQIAVITANPEQYQFSQIAYWDGSKLITKKSNQAARMEVSKTLGYIVAMVDRIIAIMNVIDGYIASRWAPVPVLFDENDNEVLDLTYGITRELDRIEKAIQSAMRNEGLTTDYVNFLQSLIENNETVRTYIPEIQMVVAESDAMYADADDEPFAEDDFERQLAFIKEKQQQGYVVETSEYEGKTYVSYMRPPTDKFTKRFDPIRILLEEHFNELIRTISVADFLIPAAKTGYGVSDDVYWL